MSDQVKETVTIPKKEYEALLRDYCFLECLQAAGVDNWSGYDDACDLFREDYPDE